MVLPLIPLAAIGVGGLAASAIGGSAVSSFFSVQNKETTTDQILNNPDLTGTEKTNSLAYLNEVNPNSKFQKPGEGWFSDYSQVDNSQYSEQNTTNNYYVTESPGTQITTKTDQKADQTSTQTTESTNPLSSLLGGLGGSILPVAALLVGGFLLLRSAK